MKDILNYIVKNNLDLIDHSKSFLNNLNNILKILEKDILIYIIETENDIFYFSDRCYLKLDSEDKFIIYVDNIIKIQTKSLRSNHLENIYIDFYKMSPNGNIKNIINDISKLIENYVLIIFSRFSNLITRSIDLYYLIGQITGIYHRELEDNYSKDIINLNFGIMSTSLVDYTINKNVLIISYKLKDDNMVKSIDVGYIFPILIANKIINTEI